jgi:hypothetical protein
MKKTSEDDGRIGVQMTTLIWEQWWVLLVAADLLFASHVMRYTCCILSKVGGKALESLSATNKNDQMSTSLMKQMECRVLIRK